MHIYTSISSFFQVAVARWESDFGMASKVYAYSTLSTLSERGNAEEEQQTRHSFIQTGLPKGIHQTAVMMHSRSEWLREIPNTQVHRQPQTRRKRPVMEGSLWDCPSHCLWTWKFMSMEGHSYKHCVFSQDNINSSQFAWSVPGLCQLFQHYTW